MLVELDDFQDGKPMVLKTSEQMATQINALKGKKQYKQLFDLANVMPSTKQKFLIQANACLHLRKWKELAEICDKGLDLVDDSDRSDFYNLKGKALGKLGQFEQKIRLTIMAIQIKPKVAAYHRNLGAAYYKLKQYQQAIECHKKAIELQPKHSINYHNKGAACFRQLKYEDALLCFQKAIQLEKTQTVSILWLADTYKELKNYEMAMENYLKAYEISQKNQYKKLAREMDQKLHPYRKQGFFARIFG